MNFSVVNLFEPCLLTYNSAPVTIGSQDRAARSHYDQHVKALDYRKATRSDLSVGMPHTVNLLQSRFPYLSRAFVLIEWWSLRSTLGSTVEKRGDYCHQATHID